MTCHPLATSRWRLHHRRRRPPPPQYQQASSPHRTPKWCSTPRHPRSARVLEIGCGDGGNLIPMAVTAPEARFTGVDRSRSQIDAARSHAETLGLDNVHFRCLSDVIALFAHFPTPGRHFLFHKVTWDNSDVPVRVPRFSVWDDRATASPSPEFPWLHASDGTDNFALCVMTAPRVIPFFNRIWTNITASEQDAVWVLLRAVAGLNIDGSTRARCSRYELDCNAHSNASGENPSLWLIACLTMV